MFSFNFNRKQIVETLIRHRLLRRLITVCTFCLFSHKKPARLMHICVKGILSIRMGIFIQHIFHNINQSIVRNRKPFIAEMKRLSLVLCCEALCFFYQNTTKCLFLSAINNSLIQKLSYLMITRSMISNVSFIYIFVSFSLYCFGQIKMSFNVS